MWRRLAEGIAFTLLFAACGAPSKPGGDPKAALVSEAERSRFQRTGRYAEVERLCRGFEDAYSGRARCITFGTTPEGRPMLAIVASADGVLDPEAVRAERRAVVLFQAGIHPGEIDGKDGGFWALRELIDGELAPGALTAATAVFVPVLNVDGHERFGRNHRPNQRGPEETGFFNSVFERKEYMEDYVAEEEARKMLTADPALRADFQARLLDPAFAKSPEARLDFFYQRHPAWDERVNLIPVYRVASSPL